MRVFVVIILFEVLLGHAVLTDDVALTLSTRSTNSSIPVTPEARTTLTAVATHPPPPPPPPRRAEPLGPSSFGELIYHPNLIKMLRSKPSPPRHVLIELLPSLHREWSKILRRYVAWESEEQRKRWRYDCRWLQAVAYCESIRSACHALKGLREFELM